MALETIEIDSAESPSGTVIWLHGLGADGHDAQLDSEVKVAQVG